MRSSGTHRGAGYKVEVAALATVSVPGRAADITKRFEDWPTEAQLAELAASHIDRSVDGLDPLPEVRTLTQGDVGYVPPTPALVSGGSDDMTAEPAKKKKK